MIDRERERERERENKQTLSIEAVEYIRRIHTNYHPLANNRSSTQENNNSNNAITNKQMNMHVYISGRRADYK